MNKTYILGGCFLFFIAAATTLFFPLPREDFSVRSVQSVRITDRHGIPLRDYLNSKEGFGEWKPLHSISPCFQQATIAVEDKRFYIHPGIDPIAIIRSIFENIAAMRFISGGSTLTQQVIRNVYPRPRTIPSKLMEMWEALRCERMYSKNDILEQYLNRAPYGNQLFGAEAASRWYFGKPVEHLSLAESAFLAALPNAPSILNPNKYFNAARQRQLQVLQRMYEQEMITKDEYERAKIQPLQLIPAEQHFRAPHAAEMVESLQSLPDSGAVCTTIDYPMQSQVQWIMRGHLKQLNKKNVFNAAAIVIENLRGEIRVLIGSPNFFDTLHNGQVNGTVALRQPGSAIKPFMYALALEHGLHPATLLADIPVALPDHHGDYVPENYDKRYHGPVRLRTALACSYNVPAVRTLQTVGKSIFLEKLKDAGFTSLDHDAEFYGYGLTLGNAEVSLIELTTAYMAFASGGLWKPSSLLPVQNPSLTLRQIYRPETAYLITDILKDDAARRPAFGGNFHFPFQCAVKTGTTKDYKDNWTIGYTTQYTVGVWVGNFNGNQMHHVSGVSGAGPIFSDIMMVLHTAPFGKPPADFVIPQDLEKRAVCAISGKIPTFLCSKTISEYLIKGNFPKDVCTIHREYIVPDERGNEQKIVFDVFPPEYASWVVHEGFPIPKPNARLVKTAPTDYADKMRLKIVSPNSGDYFKIDPVLRPEYQSIAISGFIPTQIHHVKLKINGIGDQPFDDGCMQWKLQKGVFRFQLYGYRGSQQVMSAPVVVNVE